jgi:putative ABC transport system ATP-binding protein
VVAPSAFPLEIEDLTLTRAGRVVLHGVSARFARGRVTAVVGPSGAGKSSLLRCLNRLEEPEAGRVLLDATDVRAIEPTLLRKRVGMIFQTPVLFEGGVRANLTYGLDGVSDADLAASLDAAGLPQTFLERESTALSVGQAQRVCIARALVRDPDVLLMDEPTSALDKDASARIEASIAGLAERALTVVLVTHDLEQAKRVAHEAILLIDGRITAAGVPDEVSAAWPGEGA